ncbi:fungal-specific transcription factor domain-containing protein [Halenospora varia]|nr:fungal-specific transcription factor domain-containing protein [Halenospora varia]
MDAPETPSLPVPGSSPPEDDSLMEKLDDKLRAAIQLLPSCQRCKRLRRKCDTRLPSCKLCLKANIECSFFDHSLQQILPRSYVLSLLQKAQELKTVKGPQPRTISYSKRPPTASVRSTDELLNRSTERQHFDNHFMLSSTADLTYRFFGSSSVFVLTINLAARAFSETNTFQPPAAPLSGMGIFDEGINDPVAMTSTRFSLPSKEMLNTLLGNYTTSLNTLYPFIDESTIQHDLEVYLGEELHESRDQTRKLSGKSSYQYFRVAMMCAIACANKSRHKPHLAAVDDDFYAKGLKYVEAVTSEVSGESLQALLLLVVYCLFHPRKGDIWKLLDYACRLSVELGYHTELPLHEESSVDMARRRSTFWSLYTIERIVGQIFGRPSDLPEQIITTEYPGILIAGSPTDQASIQIFSAAHHYRLVYLRSEIYREIYMPTNPPLHELGWFIDRYFTLLSWYEEIQVNETLAGVGTSTCNVAFHSTIVFLFQPLLLKALHRSRKQDLEIPKNQLLPCDNYHSACQLIRTYERVIRAPDDTPLGIYPMTIMSAHYVYLAGLTVMAYVQLAIDGRFAFLGPLSREELERSPRALDFQNIYEISGSCLVLLTWCANTWTGMGGMQDMYRKLSEKLLPLLSRLG